MNRSTGASATPRAAGPREIVLPQWRDERGVLGVVESASDVPFAVERVYWITGVPDGGRRGDHAHREIVEVLVAAAGSFTVVCDDGVRTQEFGLAASGATALLVPPLVWRAVSRFSSDAVCLVLASGPFDEDEYVRDREEFARLAGPW